MYPMISALSLLVRMYLCYISIEQLPILTNDSLNWMIGQVLSIYSLFRLICYPIVGIVSTRLGIESASLKSILYFIFYLPLLIIYWLLLIMLTHFLEVLPV